MKRAALLGLVLLAAPSLAVAHVSLRPRESPLVGDVLVLLAGAARMPFGTFIGWTTAGKAARYVAVALAVDRL